MPIASNEVVEGMARFTLIVFVLLLCARPPAANGEEGSRALMDTLAGWSSDSPRPML
jgi:hypothetical protein